ncbi:MAG: sodium:solute symporter family protein [Lentisphaeria bacterium]|nr:sodium:solute symporter family protein [Lentisphaeria bacterium]
MSGVDVAVVVVYFAAMAGIGFRAMRRVKGQADFFLGGRSFGRLLQAFAAFGAGTGSADPVNTARTTVTSGVSGMWSVMYWLFVTPFYWIAGVWYRRMRHTTLGDWFVERYESRALGVAYALFGLLFYMVYTSMLFTAVGKVAAPLMGRSDFGGVPIEYLLIPAIAAVVAVYASLGGLRAAYWTDLVQGIMIIVLSGMLLPTGLGALVAKFGDPATQGLGHGFRILHEQLPADWFRIVGSAAASEFPLYRIVAVVIINLLGIVVNPHFIATGGGSAKTEAAARVGVVAGNFIKRFCTIGWTLTGLIILALFADNPALLADPDRAWGIASRELLAPGFVGLMLACLLAALMSSADCYTIVCSALVVRNIYVPYLGRDAGEAECLRLGRITGLVVIAGAVALSLTYMDVFRQLTFTWIIPMCFAAPFWLGLYWRRATRAGAWATCAYAAVVFGAIPMLVPRFTDLARNPRFTVTNQIVVTERRRAAAPSDVAARTAAAAAWDAANARGETDGPRPLPLSIGDTLIETTRTGGRPIFWSGAIAPVSPDQPPATEAVDTRHLPDRTITVLRYTGPRRVTGTFQPDFLLYTFFGLDLTRVSNATLETLTLPPKILCPFLVMVLVSLLTRPATATALDRYYAKMRTPVHPDPEIDRRNLDAAWADPHRSLHRKLFPNSQWEFQRPNRADTLGFLASVALCFVVIGLMAWVAAIGSGT